MLSADVALRTLVLPHFDLIADAKRLMTKLRQDDVKGVNPLRTIDVHRRVVKEIFA